MRTAGPGEDQTEAGTQQVHAFHDLVYGDQGGDERDADGGQEDSHQHIAPDKLIPSQHRSGHVGHDQNQQYGEYRNDDGILIVNLSDFLLSKVSI